MIRTAPSSSGRQWQRHATGQVRLRPFFQQWLPPHNVIDRFRDVGGVVAYALYVLGAEQQMCTEPDIAWILHHIGEELAEQRILHRIDLLISAPHLESFR